MNFIWQSGKTPEKIIADVDQSYEIKLTEWKNSSKKIADVDLSDDFYLTEWKNSWKNICGCWSEW